MDTFQTVNGQGKMDRNPKVGVDARCLGDPRARRTGLADRTASFLREVMTQAKDFRFVCFSEKRSSEALDSLLTLPNVKYHPLDAYEAGSVDLLHIPDGLLLSPGFDSPFRLYREAMATVQVHDLIPLRFSRGGDRSDEQEAYRIRLEQHRTSNARLLTASRFARSELSDAVDIPLGRIEVISAGLCAEAIPVVTDSVAREVRARFGIRGQFFLHVGEAGPHRNIQRVLEAFRTVRETHEVQLIIVGDRDSWFVEAGTDLRELLARDVLFTGDINRQEVASLCRQASSVIDLSRYGGFPFHLLEAMANGCPIVASEAAATPELAEGAALMFDPDNVWGVSRGLLGLLDRPEVGRELRALSLERADWFSWREPAARTIEIWKAMLSGDQAHEPESERSTTVPAMENWGGVSCAPTISPTAPRSRQNPGSSSLGGSCAPTPVLG